MDWIKTRPLGNSGFAVPMLGLGGAPLGNLFEKVPEDAATETLNAAYKLGVRYFDTAPWYGHGLSEHRFGQYLRTLPRAEITISTKVGRVYRRPVNRQTFDGAPWAGGLAFEPHFDYSASGVIRSFEDSLQRLGVNQVDCLVIHDLDFGYHATEQRVEGYLKQLDQGGFQALADLKAQGEIQAIGAGINDAAMIEYFLDRFPIDFFLVAMPYTLLDQQPLESVFPRCEERGIGIVVGAPFASGILATGPTPDARYNYAPASAAIRDKTSRISAVCARHKVSLASAALQFPLGHPNVAAIIPGAISAGQISATVKSLTRPVPAALWEDLKAEGLIAANSPVPGDGFAA